MTYYCTFVSGFADAVTEALRGDLPDARVITVLDGGILFACSAPPHRVAGLRFLTNTYLSLAVFRDLPKHNPLAAMARQVAAGRTGALNKLGSVVGGGAFRVVASDRNRPSSLPPSLIAGVERSIASVTRGRTSRSGAEKEFWLLSRSEGIGLFLFRASRRRGTHKSLQRGQLHPEVAQLLCRMSAPSADDVFLDPFCGWGSIVIERVLSFPFRSVTAMDIDEAKLRELRARLGPRGTKGVSIRRADATELPDIEDRSVDAVVTDPPWGEYDGRDVGDLYRRFLGGLARILRPGARVVLLLSRSPALLEVVVASGLRVDASMDVLISGRKATAVRLLAGRA